MFVFFSLTHRFRDRSEETEEAEPRRADNGNNRNPSVCVCVCVQKLRKSERAASAIDNHPKLGTAFCVFASYSFCSSQVCLLLCSHRFADHDLLPQRWVFSHLFGLPANSWCPRVVMAPLGFEIPTVLMKTKPNNYSNESYTLEALLLVLSPPYNLSQVQLWIVRVRFSAARRDVCVRVYVCRHTHSLAGFFEVSKFSTPNRHIATDFGSRVGPNLSSSQA